MATINYQSFTDLIVWRKARSLKNEIYTLLHTFPEHEKFRLIDQIIRSVRSIGSNLAEGHGRYTYKDQLHFCIQARGSLTETHNHLIDALDCNYNSETEISYFSERIEDLRRLLNGYISYLRTKTQYPS